MTRCRFHSTVAAAGCLIGVAALLASGGASAGTTRKVVPAVRVAVGATNAHGQVFYVGKTLQYSALVYDRATRKNVAAHSVFFELVTRTRTVRLPASRYKPWFWLGSARVPSGLSGLAHVRATVVARGSRVTGLSAPFTIRGPVKFVNIAHSSSQGDYAVTIATGTIKRPAEVLAGIRVSPSQRVDMKWTVVCVRGSSASSKTGSATETDSVIVETLRMSVPNADSCTISFSAQLAESGSIKIDLLGYSVP